MKSIAYIIFLVFAISLCGCIGYYSDMTHLSDDELQWVNCVNAGDTILFDSDSLHCDTMVVTSKIIRNSKNRFFIHFVDNYKGDFFEAFAEYEFSITDINRATPNWFRVTKFVSNDSIGWTVSLGNLCSEDWPHTFDPERLMEIYHGPNPVKKINMELRGRHFSDCILFNNSNCRYIGLETYTRMESCVFSKDYGLIYYKLESGEEFFRRFER